MNIIKSFSLTLLLAFLILFPGKAFSQKVRITEADGKFGLTVAGKPFFIRGAVANEYFERIPLYGGNSVRTGTRDLDKMNALGLKVLVNLPAGAERNGFNYDDTAAVRLQKERILSIVMKAKEHPAILMWAIGNELDFIPPTLPYNLRLWDAINDIARSIKQIDPDHPVMTVIGTSMIEKIAEIVKRCPDLDLLGINTYGDMYRIPDYLDKYGWKKPYIITEWGPDGYWETPKTEWKAPYEQTGLEKKQCYDMKYRKAVAGEAGRCLGEFVFYWSGSKQETTHTWFCMFDRKGNESPAVDVMYSHWLGKEPLNRAPVLDSMTITGFRGIRSIYLKPGMNYKAEAFATDSDRDDLTFSWEIRPEADYASYAGQGEKEPQPLEGLESLKKRDITFLAPASVGAYRIFVYVYDGKGKFSTANLPFFVRK